jgi:hypothetical protein
VPGRAAGRGGDRAPDRRGRRARRRAVEYLETPDGRRVVDGVNANSNLRPPVAQAYGGFDPFERVADLLEREVQAARAAPSA